jgi:hypothetical protein
MGHVKVRKERWLILHILLPFTKTESEKSHLIAITLAALTFQMTRVIPPFDFEIRVGIVVGREGNFSTGERKLISEATLTLPSPWQGEGKKENKQRKTPSAC